MPAFLRATRNLGVLANIVYTHVSEDPVLFAVNVARKMPYRVGQRVGRVLKYLPLAGVAALGAQITGATKLDDAALAELNSHPSSAWERLSQRLLAEVAVSYGQLDASNPVFPAVARARALWNEGAIGKAVTVAKAGGARAYARRLSGEEQILDPNFQISVWGKDLPQSNEALHIITNSLPATQSGYTLRTHRLLIALVEAGQQLQVFTRIGYPVAIGEIFADYQDTVENITYRRLLPRKTGTSQPERLRLWAQSLADPVTLY